MMGEGPGIGIRVSGCRRQWVLRGTLKVKGLLSRHWGLFYRDSGGVGEIRLQKGA